MQEDTITNDGDSIMVGDWEREGATLCIGIIEDGFGARMVYLSPDQVQELIDLLNSRLGMLDGRI